MDKPGATEIDLVLHDRMVLSTREEISIALPHQEQMVKIMRMVINHLIVISALRYPEDTNW